MCWTNITAYCLIISYFSQGIDYITRIYYVILISYFSALWSHAFEFAFIMPIIFSGIVEPQSNNYEPEESKCNGETIPSFNMSSYITTWYFYFL